MNTVKKIAPAATILVTLIPVAWIISALTEVVPNVYLTMREAFFAGSLSLAAFLLMANVSQRQAARAQREALAREIEDCEECNA